MLILKTRILRGRNTVGFEAENTNTGIINFYSYSEVYDMAVLNQKKYKDIPNVEVCQYNSYNREIDMVLRLGNKIHLFEVKRSNRREKDQYRHLLNRSFIEEIEEYFDGEVKSRNVLYMGDDAKVKEDGICIFYKNIEKFLLSY